MTTLIGMIYNQGAILLSDTQMTQGTMSNRGVKKIYPVSDNMLIGYCGSLGETQFTGRIFREQITDYETALESVISALYKENPKEKKPKEKKAKQNPAMPKQLNILEEMKTKYGSEFTLTATEENTLIQASAKRDITGNILQATGSLVFQISEDQILINLGSAAERLRDLTRGLQSKKNSEDGATVQMILAGYDAEGPKLFEITSCKSLIDFNKGYLTLGSGSIATTPRLKDFYREGLALEQAIQLAIYAGLKASEEDVGTNDIFRAYIVSKEEGKVAISKVETEYIISTKAKMRKAKPRFPFLRR